MVDGLNGLVAPGQLTEFSALMRNLASDAALRSRLAGGARETSVRYDIKLHSAALLAYYEGLAAERAHTKGSCSEG